MSKRKLNQQNNEDQDVAEGTPPPKAPSGSQSGSTLKTEVDELANIKIFNDSVHGTIRMHPLLVKIIDMPAFQRLRNIKQLGGGYRLYPAACHNRFEHSIGVCHLAGLFIEKLRAKQPHTVKVTDEEVLCVQVAGLCHDIGHGPFSHLFDKEFLALCEKEGYTAVKHEQMSVKILKYLYDEGLKEAFQEHRLEKKHLDLICDLIEAKPTDERKYLYQIVANKNGLDVDRWDYFARDSLQLGLKYSFDHLRCMEMARVIDGDICYRDKEAVNIYNMFYTRFNLYRCAYFHPVNSAVQIMIAEAFFSAKDTLKFPGKKGQDKGLHELCTDECAYLQATDSIYHEILLWRKPENESSSDPAVEKTMENMKKAQSLLQRIERRDFYKLVCDRPAYSQETEKLEKEVDAWIKKGGNKNDLFAKVVDIGFGGSDSYPLNNVRFFKKGKDPKTAEPMKQDELPAPVASMKSNDIRIRIYSKLSREEYDQKFTEVQRNKFIESLNKKFQLTSRGPADTE